MANCRSPPTGRDRDQAAAGSRRLLAVTEWSEMRAAEPRQAKHVHAGLERLGESTSKWNGSLPIDGPVADNPVMSPEQHASGPTINSSISRTL